MAIATTTRDNVHALLEHALSPGSSAWFEVIAAGDVVAAKKPAPDIYAYALERLNLPPQVCLAFEDSYNGLQWALQVGLRTIVTVNDYTRNQDFTVAVCRHSRVSHGQPVRGPAPAWSNRPGDLG